MNLIKWHISGTLRGQLSVLVFISLLFISLISFVYSDNIVIGDHFFEFYQKNLRGYLFSGFISVGSFLLSLHTFVIINLRDKLAVIHYCNLTVYIWTCKLYSIVDCLYLACHTNINIYAQFPHPH